MIAIALVLVVVVALALAERRKPAHDSWKPPKPGEDNYDSKMNEHMLALRSWHENDASDSARLDASMIQFVFMQGPKPDPEPVALYKGIYIAFGAHGSKAENPEGARKIIKEAQELIEQSYENTRAFEEFLLAKMGPFKELVLKTGGIPGRFWVPPDNK